MISSKRQYKRRLTNKQTSSIKKNYNEIKNDEGINFIIQEISFRRLLMKLGFMFANQKTFYFITTFQKNASYNRCSFMEKLEIRRLPET